MVKAKTKLTAAAQTKTSLTQVGNSILQREVCIFLMLSKLLYFKKLCTLCIKVLGRGVFKKVGETLSVQTGDTLSLRCRGKPVQWSVPLYVEEDEGRLV